MSKPAALVAFAAALTLAAPAPDLLAQAQPAGTPGAADVSRVAAGRYKVDPNHTQVVWTVNHLGISPLSGAIAASEGTLELDPARPDAAKVRVTFKAADMATTVPDFTQHLLSADFFEADKHPTITFASTAVAASGQTAKITGDLTIKGITRPVTLDAKFFGAGVNPMTKGAEVGFTATATIRRSEFGLGYALPAVPDEVKLKIAAAFARVE